MTANPYKIITNSRKRNILVVDRLFHMSSMKDLDDSDFDAIFVDLTYRSYEETRLAMRWVSPFRVGKCFLKPWYAHSDLADSMYASTELFDGFCETPVDESFADFIEEVYRNISKYGIQQEITVDPDATSKRLANLVKFNLSRGELTYTNYAVKGLSTGFHKLYMNVYNNIESLRLEERLKFVHKIEELGYAERYRLIDRIHVCPKCSDSHLLFIECCPKCNSSDIRQEAMLHHFRCANISPESSYFKDGELVCPKCRRTLRHIGVDYDRPATVYNCTCGNTFMRSSMKVFCTNCRTTSTPDELLPVDLLEYKFTPAGIKAFATDEAIYQIESNEIYSGRSTFENFCESIRLFNHMPSYVNDVMFIFRYHYLYEGTSEDAQIFDSMRDVLMNNGTLKLANNNDNFYVMLVSHADNVDAEYAKTKKSLDRIFRELSDSNDEFDARWLKTYKYTHDADPEEFIREIVEHVDDEKLDELHEGGI
ncbi:MAG: hypothetical protein J1F06_05110 [Prevotellaceae bacterium]|nr:hypothetical protein [Prevotellaceae bacterium]